MIKRLEIRNYAIIDELEIRFSDGLTIITGETGAGKSILLGGLGLIMGKRADTKSLYHLDKKCIIEGHFDIGAYDLRAFFEAEDLDYAPDCVIRREITPSGKTRAFVNDTPVKLKVLQRLTGALVDLHQQFDTLDIHEVSFQLRLIDALAGNRDALATYQRGFREYQRERRELERLREQSQAAARESEFLSFQLKEFHEAELVAGEQESAEGELHRLNNAEGIKRTLGETYNYLIDNEQSIVGQLETLNNHLLQIADVDPQIQQLQERYQGILLELEDVAGDFEKLADATEYDGARIQELQERLDLIYRLQSKHFVKSVEELLALQAELETKLTGFQDISGGIERLEKSINRRESQLRKQALGIRKARQAVIPNFEKRVHEMLADLSMQHARLQVSLSPLDELSTVGLDEINFLFAANRGSRMQAIKDVASGGEISRLTLVTKSLVASSIPLPTLIFDEIDAGVSGDVAQKMGDILRRLSNGHQVVSITHSPQISAKADAHYYVYKKDTPERTISRVKQLNLEERVHNIAVMLSQNPPSATALENARELLGASLAS